MKLALAADLHPNPMTLNNICRIEADLGHRSQALRSCMEAIRLSPNFRDPYLTAGIAYRQLGNLTAAEGVYRASLHQMNLVQSTADDQLAEQAQQGALEGMLATTLHDQGRLQEASSAYQRAYALTNEDKYQFFTMLVPSNLELDDAPGSFTRAAGSRAQMVRHFDQMGAARGGSVNIPARSKKQ